MPKETYIPQLFRVFRQYGYDGATLSRISEATGLGKASLYHHFPGGKDEMVDAVLEYVKHWMEKNILSILQGEGDAQTKLQRMGDRLLDLYDGGKQPCLTAILLLGSARDLFHQKVGELLQVWIDGIAAVLVESGIDEKLAQQKAEDVAIAIQGSLILSQGLNNPASFQRVVQQLSTTILSATFIKV